MTMPKFPSQEQQTADLLEIRELADKASLAEFLEYALSQLEDCQVYSVDSDKTIINFLAMVVVCDKGKSQQTRILRLFWKHVHHLSADLVMSLGKIAVHYTPEVGRQELKELIDIVEDPESFLHTYSNADIHKTVFSINPNSTALNQINECAKFWGEKEKILARDASSRWANTMSVDFPELARLSTAKQCLNRLDLTIKYMSSDTSLHQSDLLSSVVRSVMPTEIEGLNSMREEAQSHHQVVDWLETLSEKHIRAYQALKEEQYKRTTEFLQACQWEKDDGIKKSLFKKAKYLATIEKAMISTDVELTAQDLLKRIVNKAGGALMKAEGRLVNKVNRDCALCYSKFCKTRQRACFAPCGHTGACLPCATRAWQQNPRCPWCKVATEKPIPLPPKLFF